MSNDVFDKKNINLKKTKEKDKSKTRLIFRIYYQGYETE